MPSQLVVQRELFTPLLECSPCDGKTKTSPRNPCYGGLDVMACPQFGGQAAASSAGHRAFRCRVAVGDAVSAVGATVSGEMVNSA